ncbi:MAG: hypothetical protein DMG93_12880 [Acidobacteria bacterium]|nr:MAG: hypothetical protein DMG93_12880 [Acidobacteriota bacterium]
MAISKSTKFEPDFPSSLSDKAYLLIRERILRGELRPGDVLSARRLAKEFANPEEVRGQCIVREALEAQSARLCCVHATMKERLDLMRMAKHLDTLYDRFGRDDDPELQYVVHTHHLELHMRIAEYARCAELKDAIESNQVLIYNWFFDVAVKRRSLPTGFHTQLLQAVTGSNPLMADQAMRLHVQYGVPDTLQLIVPQRANDWRLRRHTIPSENLNISAK